MLFPVSTLLTQQTSPRIISPYANTAPVAIYAVKGEPATPQFGVEELEVDAEATYDNPFDSDQVSLDARVIGPTGAATTVPGFLYRPYSRVLASGRESLMPRGAAGWRIRICPTEPGPYRVQVMMKDRSGEAVKPFSFTCAKSADPGFVRVSKRDPHYFETENGKSFFPIGANICWGGDRGTYSYDDWLPQYGRNGCNYMRLWLSPVWTTFALEKPGKAVDGLGFGQFDLGDLWRLDYVLDVARKNGMRAMLCFDSFNELKRSPGNPDWSDTDWNNANGGPLGTPKDFWSSKAMAREYRNKMRYLVARYSAYTNVFAWEMWNEVDICDDYNRDVVSAWHQRTGQELREMDPYHHMVTTSLADSMGDRAIDLLPQLDYAMTHMYNDTMVQGIAYQASRKSDWNKPHYVGEVGADASGPRAADDPLGLQVHDPLWISIACGTAAGAMPWWWDNLIAPRNLYGLFGAFSAFAKGIDFPAENFHSVDCKVAYLDPKTPPKRGDLLLESGPASWQADPANQPNTISIAGDKLDGSMPASLLHGIRNHPDLHNPLTLEIKEPNETRLEIEVSEVSTYGGANLRVDLDGVNVIDKTFDTGENNRTPEAGHKFDGSFPVVIPAGAHRLLIDNRGNDWLRIGYRFVDLIPQTAPAAAWATAGENTAIAWMEQAGRSWRSAIEQKRTFAELPETVITIPTLGAGSWKAQFWDTWTGQVVATSMVTVGLDGKAKVSVPKFANDLALKLTKSGP